MQENNFYAQDPSHPEPILNPRVQDIQLSPSLTAMCIGYEMGVWRSKQLAKHILEWLPEFCLKYSEWNGLDSGNAVKLIQMAASRLYSTEKFQRRGEFGEILLHMIVRQVKNTIPAISKIHYKDAANDTVKGFDCVHVVAADTKLELWLGEVKFYKDINRAIYDVVKELEDHTNIDYMRGEFAAITNKIDDNWKHSERLKKLIDPKTSMDEIFDKISIPVLLTHDSEAVSSFDKICDEYAQAFEIEVRKIWESFSSKILPQIEIHLFLFPLESKEALQKYMHEELARWK